jgi:hypothetical protein
MRRVYQFGLRPPTENANLVREQLRHAHAYRNDLVAIERGRRWAIRALDDTDAVREAVSLVKVSTKTSRKQAIAGLRVARNAAREVAKPELDLIAEREHDILLSARAHTKAFWGQYLDIEAAHRQSRSAPLYGTDAITPSDPRFVRWRGEGQIGIQLQGGASTAKMLTGTDTRCRLIMRDGPYGMLWIRVGSEGRAPIWAQFPIKVHRKVPDTASWKWVRVSLRKEGTREYWTCEITVDDSATPARMLDKELKGAIAVEWAWDPLDGDQVRVANWADDAGNRGEIVLPAKIVKGIKKPDGIRAVRDLLLNDLRPKLARSIQESADKKPRWLIEAGNVLHLWKSPERFYALVDRWRRERCDACRPAYEMLDAWWIRDTHLYDYEAGARREAHRERREMYRVLAAQWSRKYKTVLLSDQDLSREARFGDESSWRFLAGCYELRGALRNAFGDDAVDAKWRDKVGEDDEREWCERTRDAWKVDAEDSRFVRKKESTGNAWAARKAKAAEKRGVGSVADGQLEA